MLNYPETTPCPVPISSPHKFLAGRVVRIDSILHGDTANLDFTRDLQAAFRQAAPRRRKTRTRGDAAVRVFEDQGEESIPSNWANESRKKGKDRTLVSKRDNLNAAPLRGLIARPTGEAKATKIGVDGGIDDAAQKETRDPVRKGPRRRTIYVPSDDTTILTIHPGMKCPGEQDMALAQSLTALANGRLRTRTSSMRQSLAAAPKRVPLQPALKPVQEHCLVEDRYGKATGKENIPPGREIVGDHTKKENLLGETVARSFQVLHKRSPVMSKRALNSPTEPPVMQETIANPARNPNLQTKAHRPRLTRERNSPANQSRQASAVPTTIGKSPAPLPTPAIPHAPAVPITHHVLTEEVLEDPWLGDNEVTLTSVINQIFSAANPSPSTAGPDTLRQNIQQLYNSPSIIFLHKRLQASLLYGALSLPKSSFTEALRIPHDIGIRRKFVNLWTKTYSPSMLCPALEIVIGRTILESSISTMPNTRAITSFISSHLLLNSDASTPPTSPSLSIPTPPWSYRRTLEQSLLLLILLDKTASHYALSPSPVFLSTSRYQSSAAVFRQLTNLLVPSGSSTDLTRPLTRLGYTLTYVQSPLASYVYPFTNLATALRDGVRLTRLVELLLPPSDPTQKHLSEKLKYPCKDRAQKIANVQVALDALGEVAGNVKAEAVVDGHRERTIDLLVAVMSSGVREGGAGGKVSLVGEVRD